MGSTDSSINSWGLYYSYKDCSHGICSLYCPQWCYLLYPPPPPPFNDESSFNFPPIIIVLIGILLSAIVLIAYYLIVSRYCKRRSDQNQVVGMETHQIINHDHYQACSIGLDETAINSITIYKYKNGDGSVKGTECSVCLSEFQEDEDLRLLPKCNHSFHMICIDTWLKSHSNCPLCRANIVSKNPVTNVSLLQVHHEDDVAFVVESEPERGNVGVGFENQQERPSSLSVADILRIRDGYDDIEMGFEGISSGIGSSRGEGEENLMKK